MVVKGEIKLNKSITKNKIIKKTTKIKEKNLINSKKTTKNKLNKKELNQSKTKKQINNKEFMPKIITPVDKLISALKEKKAVSFNKIAKDTGLSISTVEKLGLILEKQKIIDVKYPMLVLKKPKMTLIQELNEKQEKKLIGTKLRDYSFIVDSVPVKVEIYKTSEEAQPRYELTPVKVSKYTRIFLDALKEEISDEIPVDVSELVNTKKAAKLKKRFFEIAKKEITKHFNSMTKDCCDVLAGLLLHSMYGLGNIELLMGDNELEEVAINSSYTPIAVYHKELGWAKTNIFVKSEDATANFASQIGRKIGRQITTLNPILDAHLASGDRVNATLSPISSFGNTITIRRFARRPWTIIDFISKSKSMNVEMASLLWLAMQYELNVLVAGGTASGKTSTLNALSAFIPPYHRTISIEDVREIMLPEHMRWNWIPLTTRNPNPEGLGEIKMLDLMHSSLRMRPDRIIVGEIRRQREAEVLFEAMHTGHSVYSTMHANSSQEVLRRLIEAPLSLPALQIESIDLLLVQYRDRKRNIRKTLELSEVESGVSSEQLSVNTIYRWSPREDEWESVNPARRLIRELNVHTGMNETEIQKELENRATILQWMVDNNLNDIEHVGKLMKSFYTNPKEVKEGTAKGLSPDKVLGD